MSNNRIQGYYLIYLASNFCAVKSNKRQIFIRKQQGRGPNLTPTQNKAAIFISSFCYYNKSLIISYIIITRSPIIWIDFSPRS
jgi:hypothetical protein